MSLHLASTPVPVLDRVCLPDPPSGATSDWHRFSAVPCYHSGKR